MASKVDLIVEFLTNGPGWFKARYGWEKYKETLDIIRHENIISKSQQRFLEEDMGIPRNNNQYNNRTGTPELVLEIAYGFLGSKDWDVFANRGIFPLGSPKCNIFVYEVLTRSGMQVPFIDRSLYTVKAGDYGLPPLAKDWANKDLNFECWKIVNDPQAGDVASDGVHMGIYVGNGKFLSATVDDGVTVADLRKDREYVFRRYVGTLYEQCKREVLEEMGMTR